MCPAISYPWPRLVIWRLFCQQYMMQERIVYLYYKHILGPAVSRAEHMQVNIHRRQAPHVSRRSRTIAMNFTKVSYQLPRLDDVTHCALGIRSQNRSPSGHQILSMIDSCAVAKLVWNVGAIKCLHLPSLLTLSGMDVLSSQLCTCRSVPAVLGTRRS